MGFEAFPKVSEAQKAGEEETVVENEETEEDDSTGARDYDYLLGVRSFFPKIRLKLTCSRCPSGHSPKNA